MIYKKLRNYAPERMWCAYLGILFSVAAAALNVFSYYHIYHFLEKVIVKSDMDGAIPIAIKIIVFMMISTVVYFGSVWLTHALGFRLETNLKKEGIRHIMNASFSFFDKNESGRIRKMLDDNTVLTHMSVAHLIPDLSSAVFTPIFCAVLAFYVDWHLGVLFVATFLLGGMFITKMMGEKSFMEQYMKSAEKMNAGAVEYVRGIPVLKIFRTDIKALKDFYKSVTEYSKLALEYSMSCRNWYVLFQVFFNGIFLIVMFMYYIIDSDPKVFLTKFMFYAVFSGVIFISFMKIMYVGMYVFQANSCIEKIEGLFDEMKAEKMDYGVIREIAGNDIEFKDVTFGYNDNKVVENLSFTLEAGKQYALVGASGSGKSTIAKLISGFYRLSGGKIMIGSHALEEYTEEAIAANIANVFQDAKLFKKSIYENVLTGNPDASREQVMEALHLAQCDDIIAKFADRENTVIGSKGVHLSGGEVQRITIARAILKNAGIIILDEASAAADPENEYELQRALSNLMKNKTVIMIAHRLSSIKNVDEILVIEEGKIIERGSHSDLMEQNSQYRKLQNEFMCANEWRVR